MSKFKLTFSYMLQFCSFYNPLTDKNRVFSFYKNVVGWLLSADILPNSASLDVFAVVQAVCVKRHDIKVFISAVSFPFPLCVQVRSYNFLCAFLCVFMASFHREL